MLNIKDKFTKLILISALAALSACASGPKDNISLVPAALNQETESSGRFTQPISYTKTAPGCSGECPKLVVESLIFPGHQKLTELTDHALADMTWLDRAQTPPYNTIEEFTNYYFNTAAARDEVNLIARTRYRNHDLTVVELSVGQYWTGMAHGIKGSQFLIWDNASEKGLTIDNLLLSGAGHKFDAALRDAHASWLSQHASAIDDIPGFKRMWPYSASDNVALTDLGLLVKYQPYEIAPYAWGEPELLIPYSKLDGILKPKYLPPKT